MIRRFVVRFGLYDVSLAKIDITLGLKQACRTR